MSRPAIVLAGGLGTRLRAVTKDRYPKPMAPVTVGGVQYPFLEFVLEHLRGCEVTDMVVCLGHLGDQIAGYFGDGKRFGLSIDYDDAGDALTATRVWRAAEMITASEFLVVCGDTYHPLDFSAFLTRFQRSPGWLAQLAVCPRRTGSFINVKVAADGRVTAYSTAGVENDSSALETGILALRRRALELFDPARDEALTDDIYPRLIAQEALGTYTTNLPFFDIGTLAGYRDFCTFAAAGNAPPLVRSP